MPAEPPVKRAVVFIDGQNLYHSARHAFGYTHPNYDVQALADAVCRPRGWRVSETRFYTGVPTAAADPFWHAFWSAKTVVMGKQGVVVFTRPLHYLGHRLQLPDGSCSTVMIGEEKGIDVRDAVDVIRLAYTRTFDVAVVFSQDQDLSEVATEIRVIAAEQGRWIKIASAFPCGTSAHRARGIAKTDWIRIDRATYDACLDRRDYRARPDRREAT